MNDQRQVIFGQRLNILKSSNVSQILESFFDETALSLEGVKDIYQKSNDEKQYLTNIKNVTGNAIDDKELIAMANLNKETFLKKLKKTYDFKKDGRIKLIGIDENNSIEKKIFLQIIDFAWRSHLQYLEQLRQVIGLRSYGQKDPLSEFKKEAFDLFEGLLEKIKVDVIKFLLNLNIVLSSNEKKDENVQKVDSRPHNKKIQRNEKCPCNSGKKYKHCCGLV